MEKEKMAQLVAAVRACPLVGRGSCSSCDECMSDEDVAAALGDWNVTTVAGAVEWGRDDHEMILEMALEQRWGEDSDPQLIAWNKWVAQRKAQP